MESEVAIPVIRILGPSRQSFREEVRRLRPNSLPYLSGCRDDSISSKCHEPPLSSPNPILIPPIARFFLNLHLSPPPPLNPTMRQFCLLSLPERPDRRVGNATDLGSSHPWGKFEEKPSHHPLSSPCSADAGIFLTDTCGSAKLHEACVASHPQAPGWGSLGPHRDTLRTPVDHIRNISTSSHGRSSQ